MGRRIPAAPLVRTPTWGFAVALALLMATCPSAHAGIGDLMKKAKEKVTQVTQPKQATPEAAPEKLVFDDVMLELTGERLDRILAAFQAAADEGAGRPALVEKLNRARDERGKLLEKNEETILETRRKRDEIEICYHDGYQEITNRRMQEYSQRALSDPALREKYTRAAAQYNAAAAQGDSTAIAKLNEIMQGEILPSAQDSAQVRKKCGAKPPVSPAEAKLAELDKQIAGTEEQIRQVDERVAKAQAKQGGLTSRQWAMALERIQMFLQQPGGGNQGGGGDKAAGGQGGGKKKKSASGSGSSSESSSSASGGGSGGAVQEGHHGFTQQEIDALQARRSQLKAYMG